MDNKEAKKRLYGIYTDLVDKVTFLNKEPQLDCDAIEIAIFAVDKQIAYAPIRTNDKYICPSCKREFTSLQIKTRVFCCDKCTQVINWN